MKRQKELRVIAVKHVLRDAIATSPDGSSVFGQARLDEGLLQILSDGSGCGWGLHTPIGSVRAAKPASDDEVGLTLDGAEVTLRLLERYRRPATIEIIDVAEGMESRRVGLLPSDELHQKTLLLIGAGSLGSMMGLLLAEAGVGRFVVVDNDHLDASNLSRHACDLADLGRSKAEAVADLLRRRTARVDPRSENLLLLSDRDRDDLVARADLIVATTDSPAAQFLVNESCVRVGKPGLYVGAYERAHAGEIVVVRPRTGPCLFCAVGFRTRVVPGVATKERRLAYQDADADRLVAESGLATDIALLAAAAAAHALALLDPGGMRADLLGSGRFLLIHGGSRPEGALAEIFDRPFEFVSARVSRTEPCPVCGFAGGNKE